MAYQTRATDQTGLAHGPARDPGSTVSRGRSPRSPYPGARHSTTSIAGSLLRQVCTASAMTIRKQSPTAASVTGPAAIADLRLPGPVRLGALDAVDRAGVQCEPRVWAQIRALARVRCGAETPARRLRTLPLRGDPSAATWRSSCAGQRRTALGPAARTPVRRVRHPVTPSPAMITSVRKQGPGIGCPACSTHANNTPQRVPSGVSQWGWVPTFYVQNDGQLTVK
jgi:hypothetical protein